MKAGRTSALCFEPRQALRVTSGRDLYDYFICYSCLALVVFKNDRILQTVEVGGEPTSINELLASSHLPLSKSAEVEEAARRARSKKEAIDLKRWVMAMPLALQPIWAEDAVHDPDDFATMARNPLANEFPNERERILALLRWYGSGSGPWSGYPAYEDTLAALLFEYKTSAIVASLQSVSLNEPEMEGAARLFARFDFRQQRPKSILKLPVDLKRSLLQHCLQSKSADKVERAKRAFAQ